MLRVIGNNQNLPRQEHAVASGTITSGAPVVVNTDGTVGPSAGSVSFLEGTAVNFSSQFDGGVGYDSTNNKIVVAWADESNNAYGSARVGTIDPSDNSVTFGSTTVFESAGVKVKHGSIAHDVANNRIVIVYKDEGNSSYGTAVVGTISGTSISFGTPVVFQSSNTSDPDVTYSPTAEKVLVAYRNVGDSNKGKAVVGTVSNTSISFGSIAQFDTQVNHVTISYLGTTRDKFCIYYQDIQATSKHTDAIIATISGTSVSFGSVNRISPDTSTSGEIATNGRAVYDTKNDRMIFTWGETDNGGHAIVGTVSGTSVSVSGGGTVFSGDPIDSPIGVVFDENVGKVLIFYRETVGGTRVRKFIIGTVDSSDNSISFNTEASFGPNTNSTSKYTTVYDSGSKRVVIAYDDSSNSEIGYVTVFTVAGTAQNLTSENYIGIARSGAASGAGAIIDTQGAIAEVDTEITTTGFVISSGSYDSKSFSVASQETNPKGVFFKTDGTKMYVVGTAGGAVFQYGLSTAFDVSTASYDNVSLTDFNVVSNNRNGSGLFFHPDGTYIFIVETSNQTNLVRLTLSTPWDLTTAGSKVTNSSLPTNKASNAAQGIFFKPDGSKMYLCENRNAGTDVHGFDLSTNWDISSSSVSSDSSFETTTQDNEIGGLFLNTDGSEFYLIGYQNDKVYRYTISTPYDISTSTFEDDFSVGSQENQPEAVTFKPDGTKMYIVGPTNDTVFQYSTSTSVGGPITPGQSYFVQTDGTLGTTAADPSVFAGTAVSATELIVKG